ncbi:MAG TPA: hypothetical protein VGM95_00145 [Lactobacillaceae bacterium]
MTNTSGFSNFEKEAMKQRAEELRRNHGKKNGEADVFEKISEMTENERNIALNLHKLVAKVVPELNSKTWYGMPVYANKNKKVILFFKPGGKYQSRISTIGFEDAAQLDEGDLWPIIYGIQKWTPAIEDMLTKLVQRAIHHEEVK